VKTSTWSKLYKVETAALTKVFFSVTPWQHTVLAINHQAYTLKVIAIKCCMEIE
jgi:hypothetical protein